MSSKYLNQFRDKILGFESKFSMEFKDKELLFGALDHAYSPETKKQYALAGDALLDYFLFDYLIRKRGFSKGDMDDLRQDLNADNKLADIGREIGLKPFIIFPIAATEEGKKTGSKYYNDTVEALVYVISKDQGMDTGFDFVRKNIINKITDSEIIDSSRPKGS